MMLTLLCGVILGLFAGIIITCLYIDGTFDLAKDDEELEYPRKGYTYWNVVKREVNTGNFITIVKSYRCFGQYDYDAKLRAIQKAEFKNSFRRFFPKYYYEVEFDFE